MKRVLSMTLTLCICGLMLISCGEGDEASSEIVPAYKSSPNSSYVSENSDTSSNESSEVPDTVTSQGEASSEAQSQVESKEESREESTASTVTGVGDDKTDNKNGDIIYIEGVGFDILSVVNKKNVLPEEDTHEPDLVILPDRTTDRGDREYKADRRAAEPLDAFLNAARDAGHSPIVYSAYRTYQYQKNLYEKALKRYMDNHEGATREDAIKGVTETAPTGTSEHCIGLAFDIYSWSAYNEYGNLNEGFEDYELCKWMHANAHKYGFIVRYPKGKEDITMISYEPWHFRYVGVEAATEIYNRGICLEEYTGKL